jgi:uncharacterized protein (DUF433 family)
MAFENKLALGNGIYTVPEIARILRVPYSRVNTWLNKYWNGDLGTHYQQQYSWDVESSRAVGFHTLVEFYVMMHFSEAGVKPSHVLKAHKELSKKFHTKFPFAQKDVIEGLGTDGKRVYFNHNNDIISLDGTKQLNLRFIIEFFKNLEFDSDYLASRLWPLGKDKAVICDPHHKFGQPVIEGTNIQTEAVYKMYLAKEPIRFIAGLYEIPLQKVKDAISFHKPAA